MGNSIYDVNETMRMIGKQDTLEYLTDEFKEVLAAHRSKDDDFTSFDAYAFDWAIDFYLLGIITGKRLERSRKAEH